MGCEYSQLHKYYDIFYYVVQHPKLRNGYVPRSYSNDTRIVLYIIVVFLCRLTGKNNIH